MEVKSKALEYYRQQKYRESILNAKMWLRWSKRVGNKREEGEACKILAWSHRYLGKYEESIKFGNEAFRIAKEELDGDAELDAYVALASSYVKLTPEKRSKETSPEENASDSGLHQSSSHANSQGQASGLSLNRGTSIMAPTSAQLTLTPAQEKEDDKSQEQAAKAKRVLFESTGLHQSSSNANSQGQASDRSLNRGTSIMASASAQLTLTPAQEKEDNKSQEQAAKAKRVFFENPGLPEGTVNVKWRRLAFEKQAKDSEKRREHAQNRRRNPYNRTGLHQSSSKENSQGQASGRSLNRGTSIMAPTSAQLTLTPAQEKDDNKSQEQAAKAEIESTGSRQDTGKVSVLKRMFEERSFSRAEAQNGDESRELTPKRIRTSNTRTGKLTSKPANLKEDDKSREQSAKDELRLSGNQGVNDNTSKVRVLMRAFEDVSESREHAAEPRHSPHTRKVPDEIIARGPEAKRAYENALKNGKVKVYRGRIMFIGQDRAGKTSLKKHLLGLPFDPDEESTDGVEVDPSAFEFDVDHATNWKISNEKLNVSHFVNELAKIVAGKLQEQENEEGQDEQNRNFFRQTKKDAEGAGFHSHIANNLEKVAEEPTSSITDVKIEGASPEEDVAETVTTEPTIPIPELKIDPAHPPEDFTEILVQHLKGLNLKKDAKQAEHHTTLDLWDFAGQHLYYASYPVFLSKRAIYLLVYNLNKELEAEAQPSFKRENCEVRLRNPNSETNLDNLMSWLASVSTMCSKQKNADTKKERELEYLRPPVFIVGTHADEPYKSNIKDIESQIQKAILGKSFANHVIRPFFAISNKSSSDEKQLVALQDKIIEVIKQEPYMGEELPLRWFNFEKVIKSLVAANIQYLGLKDLRTIVQEVCFIEDEKEMDTMLDFYHDLGIIVKHRNTVILQSQWLIDIFRKLITIRHFNDMKSKHSQLWKKMEITGVLSMELVDHVFSKFCQQSFAKENILHLMEQFGLIAKCAFPTNDVKYFVPAQLRSLPGRLCHLKPALTDPCPLYLQFPSGFVPHGLFTQLVSRFTRWCSKIEFKEAPHLFDGVVRLTLLSKDFAHQLICIRQKSFIKFVLRHFQTQQCQEAPLTEIEEMAALVWRFLKQTMTSLLDEWPYLTSLEYHWCVECPHCSEGHVKCDSHGKVACKDDDCSCLLKILQDGQMNNCPKSFDNKTTNVPGLEKWFPIKAVRPGNHPGTDLVYKMTALPRGIALIINNKLFVDNPVYGRQTPRHGAEEDVRQVKEMFSALGFEVHIRENRTKKEMLKEVKCFAYEKDHSDYDCFVLWLMSHGRSGEVFGSDGFPLPIQAIKDMLSNASCATLRGKPKLLFVQACRGEKEDEGFNVLTKACSLPSVQISSPCPDKPRIDQKKSPSSERTAGQTDFLTAYSTVEGYVSYRFPNLGSNFVRALVNVFREHVAHDHLVNLLTKVIKRVSDMEAVENARKFKQAPQIETTLAKDLWF